VTLAVSSATASSESTTAMGTPGRRPREDIRILLSSIIAELLTVGKA
jgi:hypothetical protein